MAKRKIAFIGATSIEPYFAGLIYDFFADIEDFTVSPTKAEFLQMYYGESSSNPSFTVSYQGITLQCQRGIRVSALSSSFKFGIISPASLDAIAVVVSTTTWSATSEKERAINLEVIYGENIFLLRAGNYGDIGATRQEWLCLFDTDNSSIFCESKSTTTNNFSSVDFKTDTNSVAYRISPICRYTTSNNNDVDIYDYVIMKQNTSGVKAAILNVDELKSCSPVPANTLITIDNQKWLSLGTHLLIEIEDGEQP